MEMKQMDSALDLGTWLGRRQAFAMVAGRCSAADAECLRKVRNKKLYRACGLTWEEFCREKAGISRSGADQIIRQLEELGPAYFRLSSVTRITPESFRLIAPAVSEQGIEYSGELIPFSAENTSRLAAAIDDLRTRAEPHRKESAPAAEDPARRVRRAEKALDAALAGLESVAVLEMDPIQRHSLLASVERGQKRLGRVSGMIPR